METPLKCGQINIELLYCLLTMDDSCPKQRIECNALAALISDNNNKYGKMNKKNYFAPSIQEMHLAMTAKICQGSNSKKVTSIKSNADFKGPTGGTGGARTNDRGNDAEWGDLW